MQYERTGTLRYKINLGQCWPWDGCKCSGVLNKDIIYCAVSFHHFCQFKVHKMWSLTIICIHMPVLLKNIKACLRCRHPPMFGFFWYIHLLTPSKKTIYIKLWKTWPLKFCTVNADLATLSVLPLDSSLHLHAFIRGTISPSILAEIIDSLSLCIIILSLSLCLEFSLPHAPWPVSVIMNIYYKNKNWFPELKKGT